MSAEIRADTLLRALDKLHDNVRDAAREAMRVTLSVAKTSAKNTPLFKDGPTTPVDERLRNSLVTSQTSSANSVTGKLKADSDRASFVEYGTPPHEIGPITPKKAGALRFVIDGKVLFRKYVAPFQHPGTKARPFMAEAQAVGEQALEEGLAFFTDSAISRFNSE